jgi:sec-independent protein translocase protein TatA
MGMFGSIGMPELIIILVIALIFFGPGKLPELGNTIGKAIRGFKKAMDEPEKKPDDAPDTQKISDKKE